MHDPEIGLIDDLSLCYLLLLFVVLQVLNHLLYRLLLFLRLNCQVFLELLLQLLD